MSIWALVLIVAGIPLDVGDAGATEVAPVTVGLVPSVEPPLSQLAVPVVGQGVSARGDFVAEADSAAVAVVSTAATGLVSTAETVPNVAVPAIGQVAAAVDLPPLPAITELSNGVVGAATALAAVPPMDVVQVLPAAGPATSAPESQSPTRAAADAPREAPASHAPSSASPPAPAFVPSIGEAAIAATAGTAVAFAPSVVPVMQMVQPGSSWMVRVVAIARRAGRFVAAVPLFGLFSRIEQSDLVRQPARAQIIDAIQSQPGRSIQDLCDVTGLAWSTVLYHMRRLEDGQHVVSQRDGRERRFWIRNSEAAAHRRDDVILLHDTPRRLAELIQQRPGAMQKELCAEMGIRPPVASKHLANLRAAGMILVEKAGRTCHYHPGPNLRNLA